MQLHWTLFAMAVLAVAVAMVGVTLMLLSFVVGMTVVFDVGFRVLFASHRVREYILFNIGGRSNKNPCDLAELEGEQNSQPLFFLRT